MAPNDQNDTSTSETTSLNSNKNIPVFNIESYNPDKRDELSFDRWLQRLTGAFKMFNIAPTDHQSYLLHYMGPKTYNILADKVAPESPYSIKYEKIVQVLNQHFHPEPLEISEIFRFHRRMQQQNENLSDYLLALRKLATHCNFGDYLKKALRNQYVCGQKSEVIRFRLLEARDLTLEKAVEIATAMELSVQDSGLIQRQTHQTQNQVTPDNSVNAIYTSNNKFRKKKTDTGKHSGPARKDNASVSTGKSDKGTEKPTKACYRCGKTNHTPDTCYHKNAVCTYCNNKGHLVTNCITKRKKEERKNTATTNVVEEFVDAVEVNAADVSDLRSKIFLDVLINGNALKMELDTGAAVSLISSSQIKSWNVEIKKCNLQLISVCKRTLDVLGFIQVDVKFQKVSWKFDLYVISQEREPLFGREWIKQISVDWNTIIPNISDVQCVDTDFNSEVTRLKSKYKSLFSTEVGKIKNLFAKVNVDSSARPVFLKSRTLPFAFRAQVEREIDRLESEGILRKVESSEWATPLVPVAKAEGKLRLCGDYKLTVNRFLAVDEHPLPTLDELFADMSGGKHFTKIDLNQAYLHLPVREEDRPYLTLNTTKGLYQTTRLFFGLSSAPAIWQRTIEAILEGLPGVTTFLDDIKVTGKTDAEHLRILEEVLGRLQKHGLTINERKSVFFAEHIDYCGHRLDKKGIHKLPQKVDAILNMPKPENRDQVKAFVGLINYYGRFFENLSSVLFPLHNLTRENVPFKWDPACERSFEKIKKMVASDKVLTYYNPELPLVLATDASKYAVGAVLSHRFPDGTERPIQFASQMLSEVQKKYAQVDKEAYAIIFGVKKFHQFIYGRRFKLITDCQPLTQIFSPYKGIPVHSANRMQHYSVFLQAYTYDIEYRNTKSHGNADALSRLPTSDPDLPVYQEADILDIDTMQTVLTVKEIAKETENDSELKRIRDALLKGKNLKPEHRFNIDQLEFSTLEGCVMRGQRVVIPANLQKRVLADLHQTHAGMVRTKTLARSFCWWKNIDQMIENTIRNCYDCNMGQKTPEKVAVHKWLEPQFPFERLHIDFAGPFLDMRFLIIVDAYTKWIEVEVILHQDTPTVIRILDKLFSQFGVPATIASDNDPVFVSADFQSFLKQRNIQHKKSAPYNPSTNGQVERCVQTVKAALKKMGASKSNVREQLNKFLMLYRRTPHSSTNISPGKALFGREIRALCDVMVPSEDVRGENSQENTKIRELEVDNRVSARDYIHGDKWRFGRVLQRLGRLHYLVQLDSGETWKRHINQLRKIGEDTPATPNSEAPDTLPSTSSRPTRNKRRPDRLNL